MADVATLCAEIRALHRNRAYAMDVRKSIDNQLGAYLRRQLGWRRDLPAADNAAVKARVAELVKTGETLMRFMAKPPKKPKPIDGVDAPDFRANRDMILATLQARGAFDAVEKTAEAEMAARARLLPVWPWWSSHPGLAETGLAMIVGEAGDIGGYATHSKLWKRMGVAVMDGVRQGGLGKTAGAEAWIAHGYSKSRRSVLYQVGVPLVTMNKLADGSDGRYRALYVARKPVERAKAEAAGLTVAPAASIPKKRREEFVAVGTIEKRARRYMEKRLLRDLWRAWRGAEGRVPERAILRLPPAVNSQAADEAAGAASVVAP